MTFGQKLRKLREASGMKQKEFAEKLGLPKDVYNKYENDKSNPNFKVLNSICNLLNVSSDYLIRDNNIDKKEDTSIDINALSTSTYVSIMGRDGTQKKITVPIERVKQFKKIMEATMPDIFENDDDL